MSDPVLLARDGLRSYTAVVLVAPENQVNAVIEETFGNKFLRTMLNPAIAV